MAMNMDMFGNDYAYRSIFYLDSLSIVKIVCYSLSFFVRDLLHNCCRGSGYGWSGAVVCCYFKLLLPPLTFSFILVNMAAIGRPFCFALIGMQHCMNSCASKARASTVVSKACFQKEEVNM